VSAIHRSPAARGLLRDSLRALPLILALGFGPLLAVSVLVASDHVAAAWAVIAVGVLIGVAMARTGVPPRRRGRHRSTVQRINHRAAIVLPTAAIVLATVMASIALAVA
jgi:hypothetical protein